MPVKHPPPDNPAEIYSSWKKKSQKAKDFLVYQCNDNTGGYNFLPYLWHKRKWHLFSLPITLWAAFVAIHGDAWAWLIPGMHMIALIADSYNHWKKKCGRNPKRYKYRPWGNYDRQKVPIAEILKDAYTITGWDPVIIGIYATENLFEYENSKDPFISYRNGKPYLNQAGWDWLYTQY